MTCTHCTGHIILTSQLESKEIILKQSSTWLLLVIPSDIYSDSHGRLGRSDHSLLQFTVTNADSISRSSSRRTKTKTSLGRLRLNDDLHSILQKTPQSGLKTTKYELISRQK